MPDFTRLPSELDERITEVGRAMERFERQVQMTSGDPDLEHTRSWLSLAIDRLLDTCDAVEEVASDVAHLHKRAVDARKQGMEASTRAAEMAQDVRPAGTSPANVHEAAIEHVLHHFRMSRAERANAHVLDARGVAYRVVGRLAGARLERRRVDLAEDPNVNVIVVVFGTDLGEVVRVWIVPSAAVRKLARQGSDGEWWFRLTRTFEATEGVIQL